MTPTLVPAALLAVLLVWVSPISAATLTVTDLGDSGAPGQLRALIDAAASGDTIVIPAGTITLTGAAGENVNASGDLDIRKNLTIQGAGAEATIIDGGGIDRIFDIDPSFSGGITVVMSGLTIRNGNAGSSNDGGGIRNNSSTTLTLTDLFISANTAGLGGGIYNSLGTIELTNVTVSGNTATICCGGGIYNDSSATALLTNVTVSGNTAVFNSGGIRNNGTMAITNVTVSGNSVTDGGGGIQNAGTLTLNSVTISNNSGGTGEGGGINLNVGTIVMNHTLISGNTGGWAPDCFTSGTITSQGHNLVGNNTGCSVVPSTGDLVGTGANPINPLLGPLADNGGPTATHALLPGSPAIDAGDNAGCPGADQRGIARPVDGNGDSIALCDIGAVERVSATGLVASILPGSRSVQVGAPATAFATIINAGPDLATGCSLALLTPVPATFTYQTTGAGNLPTGAPDTPADIPAGGGQSFVFALTPTAPFAPTDVLLNFRCTNADPASVISGVNTLLLSASVSPVPDIVALGDTPSHDGILHLASIGAFGVATVNVGIGAVITVTPDTGSASLPLNLSVCQTNPATAACLASPTPSVTTQIDAGATPTFSIFADATDAIPLDPATNRIFVRFTDGGGIMRGATSVAVCAQPGCP
jgi:hypothetical protein